MRIVHLLKHAVRGNGSVHMAVDLACAQADAGHEVWFASARGSYDDLLRAHGVHVTPLTEPTSVASGLKNLRELLSLARRVRPDVLHAHMMSSAVAARIVATVLRIGLVTTMHNSFDGHSWLMRLGDRVVAVSEAERALLLSRRYPARRTVTVLNGTGGTARAELPVDDIGPLRTPAVMVLSGLHRRKAVDDVVRAFALVADEHPEWHLNIVGWGAESEALREQAAAAGLADRVHLPGSTLTPWPLLAQADILATGTLADPCPLTIIEARVAGVAVVGTAVGGIPEVLDGGRAGHLVPPRTPEAMATAFRELMRDPEVLAEWRRRAGEDPERFSVRRMAEDYDRVYAQVLRGRARRRVAR